jgi:hypothetical protein
MKLSIEFVEEILHEESDISIPFTQGRYFEPHHIESEQKVFPKVSLPYHGLQITMSCGDQSYIGSCASGPTQRDNFLVIEESQKLDLKGQR